MIYVRLGTNLEGDSRGGGIGIIYGLGAGLNVGANTVVVARGEGAQVVETMEGDRILGRRKAEGTRILGDTAFSDIIGCFGTDEEAVTTKHRVSGKCRALQGKKREHGKKKKGERKWAGYRGKREGGSQRTLKTSKTARA